MSKNILNKLIQRVPANLTNEQIKEHLHSVLKELETIYSYLVYAKYKDNLLHHWQVDYNISDQDEYNTLKASNVEKEVYDIILESKENKVANVIGYNQPPVDVIIKAFDPLIKKLALQQSRKWVKLEYDDCYQICLMTVLNLHRKNYYLHKTLLERSFNNEILMMLRKEKNAPDIVSLDTVIHDNGTDETISLGDTIPDQAAIERQEQEDEEEFIKLMFEQTKEMIIELIGPRQFDQLMRDYGNKHTTSWSRKKMQQMKEKFRQKGITWKSFIE